MRLHRLTTAVCLLLALVPLALARAQEPTPIGYGQTVAGEITVETPCVTYAFDGVQGDRVVADMQRTSGSLDGVLWLRDASDAVLATNDDRPGGGLDPLLQANLPADARYSLAACRLEHPQMRVTTGTFELTLTVTSASDASGGAVPEGSLSDSVFGPSSPTATPTATPSPTATVSLGALFGGQGPGLQRLEDGSHVVGRLEAGAPEVTYLLPVQADALVALTWTLVAGEGTPALRVVDDSGRVLAGVGASEPVPSLDLTFRAPRTADLTLNVVRQISDSPVVEFALDVQIEAGTPVATPSAPEPSPTPTGYLVGACASEASAVSGLGSTDRLIDVYTAAGDSYYPDQLTRTDTFRADDDLNLIFRVQNVTGEVAIAGVFCAPDGEVLDAGESTFRNGGQYLIGLDWEIRNVPWTSGDWYAELYVNGAWELSLSFTVAPAE